MTTKINGAIGIVGGVGPAAGLDLMSKIIKHTRASKDQDHISTFMTSCPEIIPDRTAYLLSGGDNPAPGIQKCMELLVSNGATAIGLCCNTAHASRIISQITVPPSAKFINLIECTCEYISDHFGCAKIGLLSTLGTRQTGVYDEYFAKYPQLELIKPSDETAKQVHDAIYNAEYGIKANSYATEIAYNLVCSAVKELKNMGCKAVILGCTELPIVFPSENSYQDVVLIDPTDILAISLIKASQPEKLI